MFELDARQTPLTGKHIEVIYLMASPSDSRQTLDVSPELLRLWIPSSSSLWLKPCSKRRFDGRASEVQIMSQQIQRQRQHFAKMLQVIYSLFIIES